MKQYFQDEMQIRTRERTPSPSSLHSQPGVPAHYLGNITFFEKIKLIFSNYFNLNKQTRVSVPFLPSSEKTEVMEPCLTIQILDQKHRELIMKEKFPFKHDIFYIYYPSQIRVDEKIYVSASNMQKKYNKGFEDMLDEVPKKYKNAVSKYIIWEEGLGEHSIVMQESKLNESLSTFTKLIIDKRIMNIRNEISYYQAQVATPKSLFHIFMLKSKLSTIYQFLGLTQPALQVLKQLQFQMMYNFRCLLKVKEEKGKPFPQKLAEIHSIPESPFMLFQIKDVLEYFEVSTLSSYLRIVGHVFIKVFTLYIVCMQHFSAIGHLKFVLDFILQNVLILKKKQKWGKKTMVTYDICRNLWTAEIIHLALDIMGKKNKPPLVNKQEQYYLTHVSICSMLRNAVERVGFLLYGISNFAIFPNTLSTEIVFIVQQLNNHSDIRINVDEDWVQGMPLVDRTEIQMHKIISNSMRIPYRTKMALVGKDHFADIYLEVLETMYKSLRKSNYKRVAESMKVSYCRAVIMMGKYEVKQCFVIPEDRLDPVPALWPEVEAIKLLYQTFFFAKQKKKRLTLSHLQSLLTNPHICAYPEWKVLAQYVRESQIKDYFPMGAIQALQLTSHQNIYTLSFNIPDPTFSHLYHSTSKAKLLIQPINQSSHHEIELSELHFSRNKDQITTKLKTESMKQPLIFIIQKVVVEEVIEFAFSVPAEHSCTQMINTSVLVPAETYRIFYGVWVPLQFHIRHPLPRHEVVSVHMDHCDILEVEQKFVVMGEEQEKLQIFIKKSPTHSPHPLTLILNVGLKSHSSSQYRVKCVVKAECFHPFQLRYFNNYQAEQYHITNATESALVVGQGEDQWTFSPAEQMKLDEGLVTVHPVLCPALETVIDLKELVSPRERVDYKMETFELRLCKAEGKVLEPIQVESSEEGKVEIRCQSEGYEIVGKVQGCITHMNGRLVDLWIIPVRVGHSLLPTVWINKKRGMWKNSLVLETF